jgi:hypothetical protein
MLRRYWKLPDSAVIIFELERSGSDGVTQREVVPPEIWAKVLESPIETVFVTVVYEKQEPSREQVPQKEVQFTAPITTPALTFSAGSSSSHHTVASGDEYSGGAVRPSRKKNRISPTFSPGNKGWRKSRLRMQGKALELD